MKGHSPDPNLSLSYAQVLRLSVCLCGSDVLIKLGSGGPGHSWMDKCLLVPPFSVLKLSLRDTPFLPLPSSKHLSQWFYHDSSALVNTGHVGATPEALEDISQARQTFPSFQSDTQQAPVGKRGLAPFP